jgi:hypothetical protein
VALARDGPVGGADVLPDVLADDVAAVPPWRFGEQPAVAVEPTVTITTLNRPTICFPRTGANLCNTSCRDGGHPVGGVLSRLTRSRLKIRPSILEY